MNDSRDRRHFSRFTIPVVIDAPALAAFPLVPDDVSATGFRVALADKPEVGAKAPCSIQAAEEMFQGCVGQVVWIKPAGGGAPGWIAGISVKTRGEEQHRLAALLEKLSEEFGGLTVPFH
ncbi:MAG: PilZ domain-containing protein [Nitrospinota bacterium]